MSAQQKLESIVIPKSGKEIAIAMEKEKGNTDFYQALFWHDIILSKDTPTLNTFIEKYCPGTSSSNLEALALEFQKRTICDYHEFFGTNM